MNPSEIEAGKGSEKGLQGKEPDVSSGAPQVLSAPKVGGAFYAYAHPNIRSPREPIAEREEAVGPLR